MADVTQVELRSTTGSYVRGYLRAEPDEYYFCRGGGLGWGMPTALGVSLARDRSPVLCIVGDGSAMYSPQALWTAAAWLGYFAALWQLALGMQLSVSRMALSASAALGALSSLQRR